jgi:hypothetical protein
MEGYLSIHDFFRLGNRYRLFLTRTTFGKVIPVTDIPNEEDKLILEFMEGVNWLHLWSSKEFKDAFVKRLKFHNLYD